MKHLYLERLKRMTTEQLMEELNKHGKIMERHSPMTAEEKSRAYMAFKWAHAKGDFAPEDKDMMAAAIRILRLL